MGSNSIFQKKNQHSFLLWWELTLLAQYLYFEELFQHACSLFEWKWIQLVSEISFLTEQTQKQAIPLKSSGVYLSTDIKHVHVITKVSMWKKKIHKCYVLQELCVCEAMAQRTAEPDLLMYPKSQTLWYNSGAGIKEKEDKHDRESKARQMRFTYLRASS